MFVRRLRILWVAPLVLLLVALGAARPSSGAAREARYVVEPGDTLWAIATANYEGDPREAIWRIEERNDLSGPQLSPGDVLLLP